MRARVLLFATVAAAGLGITGAAGREPLAIAVRSGWHDGFGRLVLSIPHGVHWKQASEGDRLTLHFSAPIRLRMPAKLPRNVLALTEDGDADATVRLAPGARVSAVRWHDQVVIDAHDPTPKPAERSVAPDPSPRGRVIAFGRRE